MKMDWNSEFHTNRRVHLFVVLFYLFVCFFLFSLDGGGSDGMVASNRNEIMQLKIFQVLGVFVLFILPAIAFSKYLRPEKSYFLNLHKAPNVYPQFSTSVLIIFFA